MPDDLFSRHGIDLTYDIKEPFPPPECAGREHVIEPALTPLPFSFRYDGQVLEIVVDAHLMIKTIGIDRGGNQNSIWLNSERDAEGMPLRKTPHVPYRDRETTLRIKARLRKGCACHG